MVGLPLFVIMNCVIYVFTAGWLQEVCHGIAVEPPCNHLVNLSLQIRLFVIMLRQIFMQEVSRADDRQSAFLIWDLHPNLTNLLYSNPSILARNELQCTSDVQYTEYEYTYIVI